MVQFLLCLVLCHTAHVSLDSNVTFNNKPQIDDIVYEASSPDEKALLDAAKRFGAIFLGMRGDTYSIQFNGKLELFKRLHVLEFDSDRKCMSVVVRDATGKVHLVSKGAELAILDRSIAGQKEITLQHVNDYATLGLRTLLMGTREIEEEELKTFNYEMGVARSAMDDREEKLAKVFELIEKDLTLLGATAIEDRLQDGVMETLQSIRQAGIKVWVLTGDKKETAVNISYSCGLFDRKMKMLYLSEQKTSEECFDNLEALSAEYSCIPYYNIEFSMLSYDVRWYKNFGPSGLGTKMFLMLSIV